MKRFLPSAAAVLLVLMTVVGGLIVGRTSQRWGPAPDTLLAANAIQQFPREFAGWSVRSDRELTEVERRLLRCNAYFSRTYANASGTAVHVAVLLGPPGPLSVHQPEICYSSRDYHIEDTRRLISINGPNEIIDEFWRVTFQQRNLNADRLHVYYAWSVNREWEAPTSPRWQYGGRAHLFQVQLATYAASDKNAADGQDACQQFLNDFLPAWRKMLSSLDG